MKLIDLKPSGVIQKHDRIRIIEVLKWADVHSETCRCLHAMKLTRVNRYYISFRF